MPVIILIYNWAIPILYCGGLSQGVPVIYLVENEIHFVCTCNKYRNERLNYFKEVSAKNLLFISMDCKEKFVYT